MAALLCQTQDSLLLNYLITKHTQNYTKQTQNYTKQTQNYTKQPMENYTKETMENKDALCI